MTAAKSLFGLSRNPGVKRDARSGSDLLLKPLNTDIMYCNPVFDTIKPFKTSKTRAMVKNVDIFLE